MQVRHQAAGCPDRETQGSKERRGGTVDKGAREAAAGGERQVPEAAGGGQEGAGAEQRGQEGDQPCQEGHLLPDDVITNFNDKDKSRWPQINILIATFWQPGIKSRLRVRRRHVPFEPG